MAEKQMSESLWVGLLLALAGGVLDSYSYLNRGQVFATAETGNIVLLGIQLAQGQWRQAARYLLPILAFTAGVLVTEVIRRRLGARAGRLHWRQPVLLAECLVLGLVSLLPLGRWDPVANMLISFTSAIQIESFRKFRDCPCATTMCTGNLRSGTEHLFRALTGPAGSASGGKAAVYYGLILAFVSGAAASGLATPLLGQWTVLLACPPMAAAFLLMHPAPRR